MVTRRPRDSRMAASEASAISLPREETTPPVTNTYLVIIIDARGHRTAAGNLDYSRNRTAPTARHRHALGLAGTPFRVRRPRGCPDAGHFAKWHQSVHAASRGRPLNQWQYRSADIMVVLDEQRCLTGAEQDKNK